MLSSNLITPAAITHFQNVLQAALPGPLHAELRATLEEAANPPIGVLSETRAAEILGLHAFWVGRPCEVSGPTRDEDFFREGFQEGWIKGAREYCLQCDTRHHTALLQSLASMDQEIVALARKRDQSHPRSEVMMRFERERYREAQQDFLRGRRALREAVIQKLQTTPSLHELVAPERPEQFGLRGFIDSLFGWETGVQLFSRAGESMEGLSSEGAWIRALERSIALDQDQDDSNSEVRIIRNLMKSLSLQTLPDHLWMRVGEESGGIVNMGLLRKKGGFTVAQYHPEQDGVALTRLGLSLQRQSFLIGRTRYLIAETIDEGEKLLFKLEHLASEMDEKNIPPIFTFRVRKPPSAVSKSEFMKSVADFLKERKALTDATWGDEIYDLSAYLEVLALDEPGNWMETRNKINGIPFKLDGTPWRLFLIEKGKITNSANQTLYDYSVRPDRPDAGAESVEFMIRFTSLGPSQAETIQSILHSLLTNLLNASAPSQNFSFGGRGQIWRVV